MTHKAEREKIRQRLEATGRELEAILSAARDPSSPARAELGVRASWRLADRVARLGDELKTIRQGEPAPSHPTKERVRQAGELPRVGLVVTNGVASAVSHRFEWPVRSMHAKYLARPQELMDAARFRSSYFLATAQPATAKYAEERINFSQRRPDQVTPESHRAQVEFAFVWKRLEEELKTLCWVLILQLPLPNDDEPLSPTAFGRRMADVSGDREGRWYAFGMMRVVLVRLSSIYRILDHEKSQQRKLA